MPTTTLTETNTETDSLLPGDQPVFTIAETTDILRISKTSMFRLLRNQELPTLKVGGRTFIRRTDLERFIYRDSTAN